MGHIALLQKENKLIFQSVAAECEKIDILMTFLHLYICEPFIYLCVCVCMSVYVCIYECMYVCMYVCNSVRTGIPVAFTINMLQL